VTKIVIGKAGSALAGHSGTTAVDRQVVAAKSVLGIFGSQQSKSRLGNDGTNGGVSGGALLADTGGQERGNRYHPNTENENAHEHFNKRESAAVHHLSTTPL